MQLAGLECVPRLYGVGCCMLNDMGARLLGIAKLHETAHRGQTNFNLT